MSVCAISVSYMVIASSPYLRQSSMILRFGRDYARGFLEKEATMDVQSVFLPPLLYSNSVFIQ